MDFIQKADAFAAKAHTGQKRKFGGENYIEHPRRVAAMIAKYTKDPVVIAAALLHDTVEDCEVSLADLKSEFGSPNPIGDGHNVYQLVDWLSESADPEWNRATRKAWEAGRLSCAPYWAQSVKLCDLIDNTRDIVEHDPGFAKVYLAEKRVLLSSLQDCVPVLWNQAWHMCKRGEAILRAQEADTHPKGDRRNKPAPG